ncbi:type VII secretion protein EccB [Yinghuangia sp. YIM S09857]|uniref:type VII secretion protein EccB n=1 Tax=Yinghuangia sp. YIM S09857 TaxID=3436929 RepID=UPI003F53BD1E
MASRREQLDAYNFARRRLVAGFLQPVQAGGSEEKAPRPFRAILPGIIVGALILTAFGVYGLIRPGVPPGWKNKGSLIVGRDSASRYVYLEGKLHPVLNIASGRLLLDPGKFKVNLVPEKALNSVDHGAPLGIPEAPDRLPSAKEVRRTKTWTVCERPLVTADHRVDANGKPQRSLFIGAAPKSGVLQGAEALFVKQHEDKAEDAAKAPSFVVQNGRAYKIASNQVRTVLALDAVKPQMVTKEWLDTLEPGQDIDFPTIPNYGTRADIDIPEQFRTVGTVLQAESNGQHYVVAEDAVLPVSPMVAALMRERPDARDKVYKDRPPTVFPVAVSELGATISQGTPYAAEKGWPAELPQTVNRVEAAVDKGRTTLCNTYTGTYSGGVAQTQQSAWTALPERLVDGMGGVYVEPGAGALIREVTGRDDDKTGIVFLITDAGLRHQIVNDPPRDGGAAPAPGADSEAKIRLGYKGVEPTPVPRSWTELMPVSVPLSVDAARNPQTS